MSEQKANKRVRFDLLNNKARQATIHPPRLVRVGAWELAYAAGFIISGAVWPFMVGDQRATHSRLGDPCAESLSHHFV